MKMNIRFLSLVLVMVVLGCSTPQPITKADNITYHADIYIEKATSVRIENVQVVNIHVQRATGVDIIADTVHVFPSDSILWFEINGKKQ